MQPQPLPKQRSFTRFKAWLHRHPFRTYALIGLGIIIAGGMTTGIILWQQPKEMTASAKPKVIEKPVPKPIYYSPLNGEVVDTEQATSKPVTGIMIENSPSARPQSGLKDAEIVYEAVAEGGITRFLALYQQHQPSIVGPVRSVRLYFVDWVTPFDASIAHVGGSYKALKLVRNGSYRDLDQFFNGNSYQRVSDRYAPHNVYTSFAKLNQLNSAKGYTTSKPIPFERGDETAGLPQDATTIRLHISGPLYDSMYTYDAASKLYARSQAGAPHVDREAGQIQAKVVVALKVDMSQVFEDGYRESITTTGSGDAVIFQNGHATQVRWQKDSQAAQLRFTTSDGQAFKLARGTTWITAIPNSGGAVSWQ